LAATLERSLWKRQVQMFAGSENSKKMVSLQDHCNTDLYWLIETKFFLPWPLLPHFNFLPLQCFPKHSRKAGRCTSPNSWTAARAVVNVHCDLSNSSGNFASRMQATSSFFNPYVDGLESRIFVLLMCQNIYERFV